MRFQVFCSHFNDMVDIEYTLIDIPVIGTINSSKPIIESCTHSAECTTEYHDCPAFKELTKL